jgi:hypothetical protein
MDAEALAATHFDSDPVSLWADLSDNGRDLSQETAAAQPLYKTDGTRHWVSLDGVDDYLGCSAFMADEVQNGGGIVTVQMVVSADTLNDKRLLAEGNSLTNTPFFGPVQSTGGGEELGYMFRSNDGLGMNAAASTGATVFDDTARTLAVTIDGTLVSTYVDGVFIHSTDRATSFPITVDQFALGCINRTTPASFFNGDVFAYVINPAAYDPAIDALLSQKGAAA